MDPMAGPSSPLRPSNKLPPFDRGAAAQGLANVSLESCKLPASTNGHIVVIFDPKSGGVSDARVDSGPLVGTATAGCVEGQFRRVSVPPFDGSSVRVGKAFGASHPSSASPSGSGRLY